MENQKNSEPVKPNPDGLDQWNDRLDENLESEQTGDIDADEKAREYAEQKGSGDQSDEEGD